MTIQYILDTDQVSLFQRQHPRVVERVLACPPELLAITIITVEEQIKGRMALIHRAQTEADAARSYTRLGEALGFFRAIQIVQYTDSAIARYTEFRRQGLRIGTHDLRIAAIAQSLQATLITRNTRDFGQVPGLQLDDWSLDLTSPE